MNLQDIKYDAFISYRHCELDQFVAVNLHKELEAFRLPKVIAGQLKEKGISKRRIERVFRDRDELPITNNLADPITNALQNSEFLLVICSPRLCESLWCRTEIQTFINMHGRDHVFAVLAEGEPEDSFPKELLYMDKITVDGNGNEHVERIPVEPLAADVRGKNKREIRKKIKEEVLRLAAPMFDCSYDDLKQRHRERTIRKIIAIAGGISAVFATFGIVSSVLAYRINEQSIQIKEQSKQIKEQADQINVQYQEALRTNAKQMAEDAFALLEQGDVEAAKETAYEALSGEMPYTAEAEYALASALQVYRDGSQIAPKRLLKQNSQIDFCKKSPDMTKLMVVDIFGKVEIYDPLTGESLYGFEDEDAFLTEYDIGFADEHTIVYSTDTGFALFDLETKQERTVETESVLAFVTDKNGKYLFAQKSNTIEIYDIDTLQSVYCMESEEDISFSYDAIFSGNGGDIVTVPYKKGDFEGVYIIDLTTQKVSDYLTKSQSITSMWGDEDKIYITAYTGVDTTIGMVYCITTDGNLVWEYALEGMPDNIIAFGADEADKIAFTQYSRLIVLSKEDGTFLCGTDCGSDIVSYAAYKGYETLYYMTRNGQLHYFMTDMNTDMCIEDKFVSNSDKFQEFIFGKGFYASSTYNDNAVAIYETVVGPQVSELVKLPVGTVETKISADEKYLVSCEEVYDTPRIMITDIQMKEVIHEITLDSNVYDFAITKDNQIVVLHINSVKAYDLISGELLYERDTNMRNGFFLQSGEVYVADNANVFYMCKTETGEVLYSSEEVSHLLNEGRYISDIDENAECYIYSSEDDKKLVYGTFADGDIRRIDVNILVIKHINLVMQDEVVYLTYLDDTVEVYDINTGELVSRYDDFAGTVSEVEELSNNRGTMLLTMEDAYFLNAEKEVIAKVQGYEGYIETVDCFVLEKSGTLYEVPRYDTQELLEMVQ